MGAMNVTWPACILRIVKDNSAVHKKMPFTEKQTTKPVLQYLKHRYGAEMQERNIQPV
jgi:hypothetical protein